MIKAVQTNKKGSYVTYEESKPIAVKTIVGNEKLTKFRAYKGQPNMGYDMKKYVAVIYEIEEDVTCTN